MKLAVLGLVAAGIGVGIGAPGLIGIGAFWVLLGPFMRAHGQRLKQLQSAAAKPAIDGATFLRGTLLWAALAIPSLVVGIGRIGIDADDANWRWLPLALGVYAVSIGGLSAALYLAGGAALKVAERGGQAQTPATLWIRSVTETGTYVNERPRLEFVFRVAPEADSGIAEYEVTKKATVPFTAMSGVKVGDGFRALVAGPEHPTNMEIHWDQPVSAVAPGDVSQRLDELDRLHRDGKISEAEYQAQRERILGSL